MLQIGSNKRSMAMGCLRANSQANSWSLYFKTKEYDNCRERHLFPSSLIRIHGKHTVYSDDGTWYHEACVSLELKHRLHPSYEKSIVKEQSNI